MMNTATRTAAKKETIWSTFGITTMALMTTMLIVSTYIKIPLPFSSASITAQTLVVNLIGMLFAPLQIVAIMVSWLLLSVMGIGGSLGKLLGPAGGYRYGNAEQCDPDRTVLPQGKEFKGPDRVSDLCGNSGHLPVWRSSDEGCDKTAVAGHHGTGGASVYSAGCCKVFCGSWPRKDPAPCCAAVLKYVNGEWAWKRFGSLEECEALSV